MSVRPGALSFDRLRGRAIVRDPGEENRTSTPLELFFDLTFVVAVGRAAATLHHELLERHFVDGIVGYLAMFFAVWWAWMNYTWFASGHDSDDVAFRLLTLVQMTGVLVLASGVPAIAEDQKYVVATIGYVIMRVGLVGCWLRVARDQPEVRQRALRFAGLLTLLQILWLLRLALPPQWGLWSFAVLALGEVLVPLWAERANDEPIFHPEHIEERYGLFTIIVLGETVLAATVGFQTAVDELGLTADLLAVGLGGLVLAFGSWWLYFDHPGHLAPAPWQAFRWGYGHVVIFASLAALGAGIHLAADSVAGHGSQMVASLAVAIPMALYLWGLALIIALVGASPLDRRLYPKLVGGAVMIVVAMLGDVTVTVVACALITAALVTLMVLTGNAHSGHGPAGSARASADPADLHSSTAAAPPDTSMMTDAIE